MRKLILVLLFLLFLLFAFDVSAQTTLFPNSPLRIPIPATATYVAETRIGTFRNTYTDYSGSFPSAGCRVAAGTTVPVVRVTVTSSGRVENWQIPTTCNPDTGSDHHLIAVNNNTGFLYECWDCSWNSGRTALSAGGAVDYAINGSGITANSNHRTTAAGFSEAMGQIRAEDLPTCETALAHGLTIALPRWAISRTFIAPAIGGEEAGSGGTSAIPMGARFALARNLDIDAIPNLLPVTRIILHAAQTYGLMVADGNSAANYNNRANGAQYAATGTFRVENGTLEAACGVNNDDVLITIGNQVGAVIAQSGLFRVTFSGGTVPTVAAPTATRTPVNTPTRTPVVTPSITPTVIPGSSATPTPRSLTCLLFWDYRLTCAP